MTLLLTLLAPLAAFAADPPPLQIAVSNQDVLMTNVTPGGTVVFYSASIANDRGILRQRKVAAMVTDTARTGSVTYSDGNAIPFRSVWVAVEMETGRFVVGGPVGYDLSLQSFPVTHLHGDTDGTIGVFDLNQVSGQMLVVRPKSGAWEVSAAEGGMGDADHARNGKLSLSVEDTQAIGNSGPPPKRLKNGDVIAVIDPHRLDVFITGLDR
jgi:hypothetical protein